MMKRGVTLVEIIVVITIALLLLGVIIASFHNINSSQALSKETAGLMAVLNQARSETLAAQGGTSYGVHLESARSVIFAGTSYSSSDPNNVAIPLNSAVSISGISLAGGGSEVIFDQLTGATSESGTITLSLLASTTQKRIITVSATGIINGIP